MLMENIFKVKFNPSIFTTSNECAICIGPYIEEDEITPLPCDKRHYFHSICIEDWLRKNNVCPLCKKEITNKGIIKMQKNFCQKSNF